ncbi:chromate transporter-domain-containing protein [Aspergillus ambiguus]|uniref:putative chromate ion transporter n=1 Tax=Aspergillus ambiguus TaxID=176160 RepID=UPI003CCD3B6F
MQLPPPFSRYLSSLRALNRRVQEQASPEAYNKSLYSRLQDVFLRTWFLGFTAFGGPPVHFQIFHQKFVQGEDGQPKWVDEQTYQELFAICQGLPGPGSTKMLFCLTLLHAGFLPAMLVFLLWSLPGAIGMYALSLGVQRIDETLPLSVYALLSGLNSSTVGIIALAAVQLAEKAIRDRLSRVLVILGACAGICYSALWYFPVLMVIGGLVTVVWDGYLSQALRRAMAKWRRRNIRPEDTTEAGSTDAGIDLQEQAAPQGRNSTGTMRSRKPGSTTVTHPHAGPDSPNATDSPPSQDHIIRLRVGIVTCIVFFASFIAVLVARGVLAHPPLTLDLFANMYLAGTVIFGGGPVVIPLLRSYVVDPGWVSGRDFLIGLALIQAFPGPNFNFAVFLGSLAMRHARFPSILGAFIAFVGIFVPGITLAVAVQSFWRVLRRRKWVVDLLRGINATAVGLVFTAVYRLWEIGYLTPRATQGQSLAKEPWWVVVAAVTYAGNAWFKVPPAPAIVAGGVLGLCWYGAVGR